MKVVILTCSTGGGHNACANHLADELKAHGIKADVVDFLNIEKEKSKSNFEEKFFYFLILGNGYLFGSLYQFARLWDYLLFPFKSPVYLVNMPKARRLKKLLKDKDYDFVLATHLYPAQAMDYIKLSSKDLRDKKMAYILTDYTSIPFNSDMNNLDHYITPSDLLTKTLIRGHVKEDKIVPLGIPVSSSFIDNAKDIRKELGIKKDEKMILITSGSMGFGQWLKKAKELSEIENVKLIFMCGTNKKMKDSLNNLKLPNVKAIGFINNMNDYLKSADIVIAKAGGLSTTESVQMRKPLILHSSIPGVETYNVKFFVDNKMALKAKNDEELVSMVKDLLENKKLQKELIKNQEKYIKKYSAKRIVDLIKK